jgi:pantetheine-phosphate adenylyltransferase
MNTGDDILKTLVYPGSFDPLTNGHTDIIERALKICDNLIITVFTNIDKKTLFTVEERVELIKEAIKDHKNAVVESYSGLLSDYIKLKGATAVVKGLRNSSDFEYEAQMALINKNLNSDFETLLMIADEKNIHISSTAVKEIAFYGGNFEKLVPEFVAKAIKNKFS